MTKKKWDIPNFYILDSSNVNGGINPNFNEKNITNSLPDGGGGFTLYYAPGVGNGAAHTKSYYNS